MKKKVAVALSGGLDSAVAASILQEKNFQVMGIHFNTGYDTLATEQQTSDGTPLLRAKKIASSLGIPLEIIDCASAFTTDVVDYFLKTYGAGKTPNPCVMCNHRIKFGVLLNEAKELGAEALATGHYARIVEAANGTFNLLKGVDPKKDQSYFLSRLTQEQLSQALFPIGTFSKSWARGKAKALGFAAYTGAESQELCFVNDAGYRDFLTAHGVRTAGPGRIVNTKGDILGQHQGLHRHTIGQRRGLGIPGPEPYYVLRLDTEGNRLIIGTKKELAANAMTVTDTNWIGMHAPEEPFSAKTRIRYRHKETPSIITPADLNTVSVSFSETQYAITPGQAAAFYNGDRVLGGGWIE